MSVSDWFDGVLHHRPASEEGPGTGIMTPQHPLWDMFVTRMEAMHDENECDDMPEKPQTRAILEELAEQQTTAIDVDGSLRFFEQHDGDCDCEVMYHVITKWKLKMEEHWFN